MKKNLSQPSQSWTHDWDNIIEKKVKKTRKSILNKIKCVKEELKKKTKINLC
jgi:triosephosphate isomerase